jgi:hypothetical protein
MHRETCERLGRANNMTATFHKLRTANGAEMIRDTHNNSEPSIVSSITENRVKQILAILAEFTNRV